MAHSTPESVQAHAGGARRTPAVIAAAAAMQWKSLPDSITIDGTPIADLTIGQVRRLPRSRRCEILMPLTLRRRVDMIGTMQLANENLSAREAKIVAAARSGGGVQAIKAAMR